MRVLFATTASAGIFARLSLLRGRCRAGHDVLVRVSPARRRRLGGRAFRSGAGRAERRGGRPVSGGSGPAFCDGGDGAGSTELYIRLHAGAALDDMLAVIEEWRPDVLVRESAEFSSLVAGERLGVRHARLGIGLSTALEGQMLSLAGPALDELGATVGVAPGLGGRAAGSFRLTMAPASLDGPGSAELSGFGVLVTPPSALPGLRLMVRATRLRRWSTCRSAQRCPRLRATTSPAYTALLWRLCRGPARARRSRSATSGVPGELGLLPPSVRVERWVAPGRADAVHRGDGGTRRCGSC